ncbi:sugar ABC transporter substrate-binding protein [Halalkalibacter lacteus]|uniref:sugar ABC transporter substrate-binding protein n=1 Tax=Halalkalibacter lacteus TaxID=3090663 RepID=UPI002FCA78B2
MKKRSIFLLVIIVFTTSLLVFISNSFAKENPKIVVVLKDLDTEYWQLVKAGADQAFQDFNVDGKVVAPGYEHEDDIQDQLLKDILIEKPYSLIVSPEASVIPILEEFVKKNIPVLLVDTDDSWENKVSYVGTNNFHLGRLGGALLASQLQPGNEVALIGADESHPVFSKRINGAKVSLEAAGIKMAVEDDEYETGREAMETILRDHPNIKGVFAPTDLMALSALDVIKEQGLQIPVIGADGINEMIELIEEGLLPGTVAQNPYDMGYLSVEAAMKVIKGENVEENIDSGVDIIIKGNAEQRLKFQRRLLR